MRSLIVHADDFGLTGAINDGILAAHRNGILTSTSIMASAAAFDDAVARAHTAPELDLGVHLTLVGERPLLPAAQVPSLVGADGLFHASAPAFMKRYLRGAIAADDVRRELDAQIARVRDAVGVVSHLDSHQHLHLLPDVQRVVVGLAKRHGIRALRHPRETVRGYMLRNPGGLPRVAQMLVLNAYCARVDRRDGLLRPDHFAGFYFGGRMNRDNLRTVLRTLPADGCTELMCHPGGESSQSAYAAWGYRWQDERDALMDADVRALLDEQGIRLARFADLAA